jgi:hypothetical protein
VIGTQSLKFDELSSGVKAPRDRSVAIAGPRSRLSMLNFEVCGVAAFVCDPEAKQRKEIDIYYCFHQYSEYGSARNGSSSQQDSLPPHAAELTNCAWFGFQALQYEFHAYLVCEDRRVSGHPVVYNEDFYTP